TRRRGDGHGDAGATAATLSAQYDGGAQDVRGADPLLSALTVVPEASVSSSDASRSSACATSSASLLSWSAWGRPASLPVCAPPLSWHRSPSWHLCASP